MVDQLGELIHTSLRQCDVAARYTETQYVIMLCGSAAETGSSPLERIKASFYRVPAHGRYLLSYSLYVPEVKPDGGRAAASAAKNSKIFPPSRKKVSRLGGFFLIFYTFHNLLPKIFYKKSEKTV